MATKEELEEQLAQTRADLKVLAGMAADRVGTVKGEMTDDMRERVQMLSDDAQVMVSQATERGKQMARDAENAMCANPLTTAGVAFGVGILLGTILRR